MTLTIHFTPTEEARLDAIARQEGVNPAALAKKLVTDHLPLLTAADGRRAEEETFVDPENAASIALLNSWLEEDATDDPADISKAEDELAEFKQNINAERARAGAGIIYP